MTESDQRDRDRERDLVLATITAFAGELANDADSYRRSPAQDNAHAQRLQAKADALDDAHARLMERKDLLVADIVGPGQRSD